MNILVFGAGAVGSTLGGMLAQDGHSVTLVGRNPHMSRIAASGLKITGLWGEHVVKTLKAGTEIPEDCQPDCILLTTKAYSTAASADLLAKRFPASIPVLHFQNGAGNAETLAQAVGWPRVLSGMVIVGFQIPLAGRAVVTVQADTLKIGRYDGRIDETVQKIVQAFQHAGIPTDAVDNITTHLWGKVLYNCALNPLAGTLGVPYGKLADPYPWSIIERLIREAFQVLTAEKQPLFWKSPEAYLDHLRTVQIPATKDHKPSLLSDLHHGRRTEIESLNAVLCALGRKHGIPTPVNDTLVALVHSFEENNKQGILHPSLQPPEE